MTLYGNAWKIPPLMPNCATSNVPGTTPPTQFPVAPKLSSLFGAAPFQRLLAASDSGTIKNNHAATNRQLHQMGRSLFPSLRVRYLMGHAAMTAALTFESLAPTIRL